MPIALFLIDTSTSMNQRTHLGTTYLDIAKGAVETLMKLRGRDPASQEDRYMLVNSEEVPVGIKAGWKESRDTFMTELKNLKATGLATFGQSLRTAFDLLNLNRLVTGIDSYGQGRNPFFLKPAIIIAITDGKALTNGDGVVQDQLLLLPTTSLPGSELTTEPFRWDQRLFALVLRIPEHTPVKPEPLGDGGVPPDDSLISPMCDVTGGRSYSVLSQCMLKQCLESLVQKVQTGVVINFEKTGPDHPPIESGRVDEVKQSPQPWHSCHKLIYVQPKPKNEHWPIPEAFWPDQNSITLPPRSAHPHVRFSCTDVKPMVIDKMPFDKYELEPSPLTQYILERKSPHTCWQVFVCNSAKYNGLGQPFGYLKASMALNCVNLFVMPYNYPVLLPLLDDYIKVHKFKPTIKWRQSFENYLRTMPPYYFKSLRNALKIMGAPNNLLADSRGCGLSYSVVSHLKKLTQQTKIEYDRLIASIDKKPLPDPDIGLRLRGGSSPVEAPAQPMEINPQEFQAQPNKSLKPHFFKNPYDIPRSQLLDQLSRMRTILLNTSVCTLRGQDPEQLHSVPIAGNNKDFSEAVPQPLHDACPDPKFVHTFGNPFKSGKNDQEDEFVTGPQNKGKRRMDNNMHPGGSKKRCMSPLCQDRAYTLPVTPPTSPQPTAAGVKSNGRSLEEFKINHFSSENHYSPDGTSELDPRTGAGNPEQQENHIAAAHPQDCQDRLEGEEVQLQSCSGGGTMGILPQRRSPHYSSPTALKNQESLEMNNELSALILQEIRKHGRDYKKIFYFLKQIEGSMETKLVFLQNIIKEATRFKKTFLVKELENYLTKFRSSSNNMDHLDVL